MANTLLLANQAAITSRERGAERLEDGELELVRRRYLGALASKARTLINRFRRYEDIILRFATGSTSFACSNPGV